MKVSVKISIIEEGVKKRQRKRLIILVLPLTGMDKADLRDGQAFINGGDGNPRRRTK